LPKYEISLEQYDAIEEFIARVARNVTEDWPLWVATSDESQQIEYKKSTYLEDRVIADIEHYYYSGKLELTESLKEAVNIDYNIPTNFNLIPLNKANSNHFKDKGGFYALGFCRWYDDLCLTNLHYQLFLIKLDSCRHL
jgi:hypothetical protein